MKGQHANGWGYAHYGWWDVSWLLKAVTEPLEREFHWGMVRKIVEVQSGEDFLLALGLIRICGFLSPLGGLFDLYISTDSGGMFT